MTQAARSDELRAYGACTLEDDGCTTCGDVGIPVRVVRRTGEGRALCEDRTGARAEVATAFTPEAREGDVLMVHMGTSIALV